MIFMTFVKSSFRTLSRRFVGFHNACVFCLTFFRKATGFLVLFASGSARHCCRRRNFQLSTRISHNILELFIRGINEINTTQFSSIVKLRFFDSPLLLLFAFRRSRKHLSKFLATESLVWRSFAFLSISSGIKFFHPVVFHPTS